MWLKMFSPQRSVTTSNNFVRERVCVCTRAYMYYAYVLCGVACRIKWPAGEKIGIEVHAYNN